MSKLIQKYLYQYITDISGSGKNYSIQEPGKQAVILKECFLNNH